MASPRAPLNINDLPEDVLSRVLSKLDTRERSSPLVCRRWHAATLRPEMLRSFYIQGETDRRLLCAWLRKRAAPHLHELTLMVCERGIDDEGREEETRRSNRCVRGLVPITLTACTQLKRLTLDVDGMDVDDWVAVALPALEALCCFIVHSHVQLPATLTSLEVLNPGDGRESTSLPPRLPDQLSTMHALAEFRWDWPAPRTWLRPLALLGGLRSLRLEQTAPEPETLAALTGLTRLECSPSAGDGAELLEALPALRSLRSLNLDSETLTGALPAGAWLRGLRRLEANAEVLVQTLWQDAQTQALESLQQLCIHALADQPLRFSESLASILMRATTSLPSLRHLLLPRPFHNMDAPAWHTVLMCAVNLQHARPALRIVHFDLSMPELPV